MEEKFKKQIILILMLFTVVFIDIAKAELVGLWKMDEVNFNTIEDSSGYGHKGKLIGTPVLKAGKIGNAIELNGRRDYIEISGYKGVTGTQSRTVAAWIKTSTQGRILSWGKNAKWQEGAHPGQKWILRIGRTGKVGLGVSDGYIRGVTNLFDDNWHHVVAVLKNDGSPNVIEVLLYIDGKLEKVGITEPERINTACDAYVRIGVFFPRKSKRFFKGLIDEVAIFDHPLSKEDVYQLYNNGATSFLSPQRRWQIDVIQEARTFIGNQKYQEAITFIENKITEYRQKESSKGISLGITLIPEMYVLLAKTKNAIGASKTEIAGLYSKAFRPLQDQYISSNSDTLIWLIENNCTDEYTDIIRSFATKHETESSFLKVVSNICKHFESKNDWIPFQQFLDILFSNAHNPANCAVFMKSYFSDQTGPCGQKYLKYLESRPKLKLEADLIVAEQYMADRKFKEAGELYKYLVANCESEDDKSIFDFQLYKCLFHEGKHQEVIPKLEKFVSKNRSKHRSIVREAMLISGQVYIQLNKLDKAIDKFLALITEYPESENSAECNFFIGYCYMLQNKFDAAREAFDSVINSHPNSSFAKKAAMYLTRLKNMTE